MTESHRLAKRVAEQFQCSRREATLYIEGGWIRVDGQMVDEAGARVLPGQQVERLPGASLLESAALTIMLHLEPGLLANMPAAASADGELLSLLPLITEAARAPGDRSGIALLKRHLRGLTLCTPLESGLSGLLVLTQDWHVARKLLTDGGGVEQEIIVDVDGTLLPGGMERLNAAQTFDGKPQPAAKVSWQNEGRLRFAVKGPQNGQIAHMCGQAGLQVRSMKRIRLGRLPLAGLAPGQWRFLLGYERF